MNNTMTRKQAQLILTNLGITNPFTLKSVGFDRDTRQVLTIKNWQPDPKATQIKEVFRSFDVIVDFS